MRCFDCDRAHACSGWNYGDDLKIGVGVGYWAETGAHAVEEYAVRPGEVCAGECHLLAREAARHAESACCETRGRCGVPPQDEGPHGLKLIRGVHHAKPDRVAGARGGAERDPTE